MIPDEIFAQVNSNTLDQYFQILRHCGGADSTVNQGGRVDGVESGSQK